MAENNDPIPYERFQKVNEARRAAEDKLQELQSKLSDMEGLATRAQELETALQQSRLQASNLTASVDNGITTKDGRELAEYCYSKLGEENRPSFNEWLTGQRESPAGLMKHAWPSKEAPKSTPAEPALNTQDTAVNTPPKTELGPPEPATIADVSVKVTPNVNGSAVPDTRASGTLTAETIRGMSIEQYKTQRDAILSSLTRS